MRVLRLLLAVMIFFMVPVAIHADGYIDTKKKGDITLNFSPNGTPVDTKFYVYKVADIDGSGNMTMVKELRDSGVDLNDHSTWQDAPQTFATKARLGAINSYKTLNMKNGTVTLKNAKVGVYLVMGDAVEIGDMIYYPSPFLISMPYTPEEGTVLYAANVEQIKFTEHKKEMVNYKLVKQWVNETGEETHPTVTIYVYHGNDLVHEVKLPDENGNWYYEWEAEMDEEPWYVWEEEVPGYRTTVSESGVNEIQFTVKNRKRPRSGSETVTAMVEKVWNDNDNAAGMRPDSIRVLLNNGVKDTEYTLSESNSWTIAVDGLDKYDSNGKEIEYTWKEVEEGLPEGYELTSIERSGSVTTITNTYDTEHTQATVIKVWDDKDNTRKKRPTELLVTLEGSNGYSEDFILSAENGWSETVTDLEKYADGEPVTYEWVEGPMPKGYRLSSTEKSGTITTLTNTYKTPNTPHETPDTYVTPTPTTTPTTWNPTPTPSVPTGKVPPNTGDNTNLTLSIIGLCVGGMIAVCSGVILLRNSD